jgi:transcription elongation factor GreA
MAFIKIPMTVEGAERLRLELENLKKNERPRIVKAIAEAREHGDLKENAEYHAAREQQSFCEGRIQEIESKLSNAQIIDIKTIAESNRVIFGTTVNLINVETEEAVTYQIVGEDEADIKSNKISVSSPIARALVGKEVGDVAVVKAPSGDIEYEIDAVRHI